MVIVPPTISAIYWIFENIQKVKQLVAQKYNEEVQKYYKYVPTYSNIILL